MKCWVGKFVWWWDFLEIWQRREIKIFNNLANKDFQFGHSNKENDDKRYGTNDFVDANNEKFNLQRILFNLLKKIGNLDN